MTLKSNNLETHTNMGSYKMICWAIRYVCVCVCVCVCVLLATSPGQRQKNVSKSSRCETTDVGCMKRNV